MSDFLQIIANHREQYGNVVIDLGCGPNKKPGIIGIDLLPLQGVDYVANLEEGLGFIPDNTVDRFTTSHFLEHIGNFEGMMAEIHRTLKPGGKINVVVPHFSNPYYYSDYTHRRFFGLYTFDYFTDGDNGFRRKVPVYTNAFRFKVVSRKLVFKSPSFFLINLVKKQVWTRFFNLGNYLQALYEDSFTGVLPCTELVFELEAVK